MFTFKETPSEDNFYLRTLEKSNFKKLEMYV